VADSLDAEQAPVGGVADLPQRGQIRRRRSRAVLLVLLIVVLVNEDATQISFLGRR